MVGTTASILQDLHQTSTSGSGVMTGPEVQANAIWTVLHGSPLRSPPGVLDVDLATFRAGRLVGTVEEIQDQVRTWQGLGIDTLILGVGAVPFQVSAPDDVELLLETCTAV